MIANTWNPVGNIVLTNGRAPFGCLLNMTGGFPIMSHGRKWLSTEALYQACRYEDREIQKEIWLAKNGWDAKQVAKRYVEQTRDDWYDIRVAVMFHCLLLKYQQHNTVRMAIEQAKGRHIIEKSRSDEFWGAIEQPDGYLRGKNALGRIWMFIGEGGTIICPPNVFPDELTIDEFFA